jgi:nicotinate phosphoribosyltransferase
MPSLALLDGRALLDAERLVRAGLAGRRASFELWFGRLPPHHGFAVVAGTEAFLEALTRPFSAAEVQGLRRIAGLGDELCQRLTAMTPTLDVDAVPDGTVVFPRTPFATVQGTFLEVVLAGAAARSILQRASAVATRTARLHLAAAGDSIVDGSSAHAISVESALLLARAAHVGGASATTNVLAAATLGLPFRAQARIELSRRQPGDAVAQAADAPVPSVESWSTLPEDLGELGAGDDEEALLLEAKRLKSAASGWVARGLCDADSRLLPLRFELVALEEDGSWKARRGASGTANHVPGRKLLVRYLDARGRAVGDVVHLDSERMEPPHSLGAATLSPVARPMMRHGRALEAAEAVASARERALSGRASLSATVTQLRSPSTYPVKLSTALAALRDTGR